MSLPTWNILRDALAALVDKEEFQVWIAPLRPLADDAARLVLGCPNAFHRNWIRDHYLPRFKELLAQAGPTPEIALELMTEGDEAVVVAPPAPRQLNLPNLDLRRPRLNGRFVFDKFIAGQSNEFAWAAARALAQGRRLFANSLFLVSGTGLGKSHLTQAVGHQVLSIEPQTRVAYLTAEDFANQMIGALKAKRMETFKERFRRSCDLLLLEEVQFLAGKEKTQDELAFTLDALMDAGKRVVFTGSCLPSQVPGLKHKLASRLACGVTAAIEPPDQPTRVRILSSLCDEERVPVNPEVLEYLAQEVPGDVRRLQSALVGLLAKGSLTGRPMDLRLCAEIVGQMELRLRRVTPENILDLVAKVYGMERAHLTGKSRKKTVTRPRNIALYLCRRHTDASFASLGRTFNRDHSTVMYGVEQVERGVDQDPRLAQELAYLEKRLGLAGA